MNLKNLIKNPKAYYYVAKTRFKNTFRSVVFRGNAVVCEICNWQGTQFFEGHCPKCNSLPRTRLIPYALRYFNLIKPELKVLHIAPNIHEYNFIRQNFPEMTIYDRLNIRDVEYINIVQDLTQTNIESETYDLAICWHVLEHIPQDKEAIKEVFRLLKPNGNFLVSVPIYPIGSKITYEDKLIEYKDFEKVHGHDDHCRSCGLDYFERFEAVGFRTDTLLVNSLDENKLNLFGLRKDHVVWCFNKT